MHYKESAALHSGLCHHFLLKWSGTCAIIRVSKAQTIEPCVIVLRCRISLRVAGFLRCGVRPKRRLPNLRLSIGSPVLSSPTWVWSLMHVVVSYLVPLFSRFSHFPFGTFVALERKRDESVQSDPGNKVIFLVICLQPTFMPGSPGCPGIPGGHEFGH